MKTISIASALFLLLVLFATSCSTKGEIPKKVKNTPTTRIKVRTLNSIPRNFTTFIDYPKQDAPMLVEGDTVIEFVGGVRRDFVYVGKQKK